jgi:acyl-CoA thioester hydrolase
MTILRAEKKIDIRFSEVDSLRVVWHGHYIKYFEDAREEFGKKYGLAYMQIFENGYIAPIVEITCNYKNYIKYYDEIIVEITYINTEAMKLIFEYKIINKKTNEIVAEGKSIQVLVKTDGTLELVIPQFISEWKNKWGLK